MATLPQSVTVSPLVTAIYAWWENRPERPRAYLGGSAIGRPCERQLWYAFRWCKAGGREFDGRMLRLFDRGHREEPRFIEELRGIGVEVWDVNPDTGAQFRFNAIGGHFSCGIDGVALGLPEAPKTYHLLEFKTHGAKSFATLQRDGVAKAKPEHMAQMQVYMRLADLTRAQYLAVNKDTDELYAERVYADDAQADRLLEKAERVITAAEPLPRISEGAANWQCKQCPAHALCHTQKLPAPNCRNCLHATPEMDGDGRWSCARHGVDLPTDVQAEGCQQHRFIPALLARWGEAVDANEAEEWVEYRMADGKTFRNGAWGENSYPSRELVTLGLTLVASPEIAAVRATLRAEIRPDVPEPESSDGSIFRWHYFAPADQPSHRHLGEYLPGAARDGGDVLIAWRSAADPLYARGVADADANMHDARGEFAPMRAKSGDLFGEAA